MSTNMSTIKAANSAAHIQTYKPAVRATIDAANTATNAATHNGAK